MSPIQSPSAKYQIVLDRHGESVANVDRSLISAKDIYPQTHVLTEAGKQQAASCGDALENQFQGRPVSVFCSPYVRARETLDVIAGRLSPGTIREIVIDGRLREQEFKDFKSMEEAEEKRLLAKQRGKLYYRFKNAESGYDVVSRVGGFYNQLRFDLMLGNRSEMTVIVAHEIVIRCFLLLTLDINPDRYNRISIGHADPIVLSSGPNLKFAPSAADADLLKVLRKLSRSAAQS